MVRRIGGDGGNCKGVWKTCYDDRPVLYRDCGIGKQHLCQNSLICTLKSGKLYWL